VTIHDGLASEVLALSRDCASRSKRRRMELSQRFARSPCSMACEHAITLSCDVAVAAIRLSG